MNDRKPVKDRPMNAGTSNKAPRLGPEIQSKIGSRLRAMYDDVVRQGVPDRFARLLEEFEPPKAEDK
jgi:hypothetical protein